MIDVMTLAGAFSFASDKIVQVGFTPLSRPTPCSRWTIRELLNHLVAITALLGRVAAGEAVDAAAFRPDATTEAGYPGQRAGPAFDAAAVRVLHALEQPGALERDVALPSGPALGRVVAGMVLIEALVHGWDLAQSMGRDPIVPEDLAGAGLEFARASLSVERRGQAFGPPLPTRVGASPAERLLAFLGREA